MKAEKLFQLEDKWMKLPGLYTMWTILYIADLCVLSVDSHKVAEILTFVPIC